MGIFKALRAVVHRGGDAPRKKDVDLEVVIETAQEEDFGPGIGTYDISDEDKAAMASRDDEMRHREQSNKQFLISNGVDIEQFTRAKAGKDARAILASFCPDLLGAEATLTGAHFYVVYSDPTKTGKVPKNVVRAGFHNQVTRIRSVDGFNIPEYGDTLSVRLDYMADGAVNKAEVIYWHERRAMIIRIRMIRGDLKITHIETNTGPERIWRLIYHDNKAEDPSDATSTVESAFVYVREGVAPNPSPTAPHYGGE